MLMHGKGVRVLINMQNLPVPPFLQLGTGAGTPGGYPPWSGVATA